MNHACDSLGDGQVVGVDIRFGGHRHILFSECNTEQDIAEIRRWIENRCALYGIYEIIRKNNEEPATNQ